MMDMLTIEENDQWHSRSYEGHLILAPYLSLAHSVSMMSKNSVTYLFADFNPWHQQGQ